MHTFTVLNDECMARGMRACKAKGEQLWGVQTQLHVLYHSMLRLTKLVLPTRVV